jgi:hypothetical protein
MNNSVFAAMTVAAILVFTALHSNSFAHVSYQQRYNDRYSAGSDYAVIRLTLVCLFGIFQVQDDVHKVLLYLYTDHSFVHYVKRNYSPDGMLWHSYQ